MVFWVILSMFMSMTSGTLTFAESMISEEVVFLLIIVSYDGTNRTTMERFKHIGWIS
jgi:hypothetical protein